MQELIRRSMIALTLSGLTFSLAIVAGCDSSSNDVARNASNASDHTGTSLGLRGKVDDTDSSRQSVATTEGGTDNKIDLVVNSEPVVVRLGTVPAVKLAHSIKATAHEAIDTMSGDNFLPLEGMSSASAFLLTDHELKSSPALRKLVELGPKSLPFLLAALDDKTRTKLVMTQSGGFGGMWYSNECSFNPMNPTEQKILGNRARAQGFDEEQINTHTVTIGDICFVAIGQIVGRGYQAVRYQPTACIVINSPTHDAKLCQHVRSIWSSTDAAQKLLDSLLLDYATEGIFNGDSLDGWDVGSSLQIAAAMRLLYYFPEESTAIIAERLDSLDVKANGPGSGSMHTPDELERSIKQDVANGVRAADFVKAVAWCREPKIKAAMLRIFERATDPDVVIAAVSSVGPDNSKIVRERVATMIDDLAEESGPFGDGYNLLITAGKYGGTEAKAVFRKYLDRRSVQHCRSICHALRTVRSEWAAELLAPLLDDRREADGWNYAVDPPQNEPRLPIRICDEAAETIATANNDIKFEMRGSHADLDRQIDAMKVALKKRH